MVHSHTIMIDNQTGSDGDSKYKKGSWKTSNDNSSWSWTDSDINYQLNIAQSNYENGLIAGNENKICHILVSYTSSVPMLISVFTRVSVTYLL